MEGDERQPSPRTGLRRRGGFEIHEPSHNAAGRAQASTPDVAATYYTHTNVMTEVAACSIGSIVERTALYISRRSHALRDLRRIEQTHGQKPPCSMSTCLPHTCLDALHTASSLQHAHSTRTRTLRGWSKLWVRGASRGHSRARTCAPHGTAPLSEALGRSRIPHYSVADRAPIVIGLIAYAEF